MFKRERTLVVLFVLLQQIAAHVAILKHLLKLCRECGPALLHAELGGVLNKKLRLNCSTVLSRAIAAFSRSMLL
jgi:hypothetical protein